MAAKKTNYLNNRSILEEIHKSKTSYCSFICKDTDHQFDIILNNVSEINKESIEQAIINKVTRLSYNSTPVSKELIIKTDLVFRVMTWEHIPLAPPKISKNKKNKLSTKDLLKDFDVEDTLENVVSTPTESQIHVKVNFPPFFHYKINNENIPYLVGKSHWIGDLTTGHFSKDHGAMTDTLALMFMKLVERYSSRGNWSGYSYKDEMKAQALLQLSMVGLSFNEAKSNNPFAYSSSIVENSFLRIQNIEKRNQNMRDNLLIQQGYNPSFSKQTTSHLDFDFE